MSTNQWARASDDNNESDYESESDCDPQVDAFGNTIDTPGKSLTKSDSESEDELPPPPVELKSVRFMQRDNCSSSNERTIRKKAERSTKIGWIRSGQMTIGGAALFGAADEISQDLGNVSSSIASDFRKARNASKSEWDQYVAKQRAQSKAAENKRRDEILATGGVVKK